MSRADSAGPGAHLPQPAAHVDLMENPRGAAFGAEFPDSDGKAAMTQPHPQDTPDVARRSRGRKSIRNSLLLNMTLVTSAAIVILAALWVRQEYARFGRDAVDMRERLTYQRKVAVKDQVANAIDYIDFKRSQGEERMRQVLKDRVYGAYGVATGLYERYKDDKSPDEIRSLIKEALRPTRFHAGRDCYFAVSANGIGQLYPLRAEREGQNLWDETDGQGHFVIRDLIATARAQGEGYYDYTLQDPEVGSRAVRKLTFVRYVEPLDWVIGADETPDEIEKVMQQEVVDWLAKMKIPFGGYIFAGRWDGATLLGPGRGRNNLDVTDANGMKVVRELIDRARHGGGFVEYIMPAMDGQRQAPKISFAAAVNDWKWYVGAGVYLDDVEVAIERERKAMQRGMMQNMLLIGCALTVLLAAAYLMSRRMADKTEAAFGAFSAFFEKAATESVEMAGGGLNFAEFENLAASANHMVRERRAAEAAVRDSEARYRLLFDAGSDAVYVHAGPEADGLPGRYIEVNDIACKRLGYSREEFLKLRPLDINPPEMREAAPAVIARLLKDKHYLWEGVHVAKDGRRIPVEVNAHLFELKGRQVILSSVRDITERKRAEEERTRLEAQLRQSQKMEAIGQLAGGVAHDFNNLLQVIAGYTDMAMAGLDAGDRRRADLAEVKKAAARATSLTRQLLTFGRREEYNPECIDLNDVISNMTRMLRRVIGEHVELNVRSLGALRPVCADIGQMEQVLMNLSINARDAMPGGGRITIETGNIPAEDAFFQRHAEAAGKAYVLFSVSDTGVGIPREVQERIFEPFFTTKDVGAGTGLGLATVYAIVRRQGGVIEVESEAGKGTTFRIYLEATGQPQSMRRLRAHEPDARGGDETILLAEDDVAVCDLTVTVLEKAGYSVIVAHNGEEAVTIARERGRRFQLAILDVVMPKKGGREAREALKEINPGAPVLFASGYSYSAFEGAAPGDGDEDLIRKPYSSDDLLRKVRQMLDKRKG
jgi:two-component system, cell cycle sensor histidine kinase and response regulator CckA